LFSCMRPHIFECLVSMSIQSLGCGHDSNYVDLQDLAMTYDGCQNLCS
jgi:hypothetical protein